MALTTPTTTEISESIVAAISATISQAIPLLPRAFTHVLARALAGVVVLLYKYAGFIFLQMFVRFSTNQPTEVNGTVFRPLTEWGRLIGLGDPLSGTDARMVVDVPVIVQSGTLSAGQQLVRTETQIIYVVEDDVALDAPTVQATVVAAPGNGAAANLQVGDVISFVNPIGTVGEDATVASIDTPGTSAEETENYRSRVIGRFQARPQGGALADYRIWGEEVPGVANVYPASGNPGTVSVFVESTIELEPDGIASQAILDEVEESINLDPSGQALRRPANAFIFVLAIERLAFDVTIAGLVADNPTAVQASITEAIDEYLRDREPFTVGLAVPPRRDRITATELGGIVDAVVRSASGTFSGLTLERLGVPITEATLFPGQKAKAGTVNF